MMKEAKAKERPERAAIRTPDPEVFLSVKRVLVIRSGLVLSGFRSLSQLFSDLLLGVMAEEETSFDSMMSECVNEWEFLSLLQDKRGSN